MPRAFHPHEEEAIRAALRSTGKELFENRGVAKTSIEEITRPARIAKGSFYKFYPSKEALFFELLEGVQDEVRAPLVRAAPSTKKATRRQFEILLREVLACLRKEPIMRIVGNTDELMQLARRVPPELLARHQQRDQEFIRTVVARWNQRSRKPPTEKVAAHFSLLLMIQHNETLLGDRLYPHAEDAIVASFSSCFFP
ncbi:MAG: TetR/AcrR family transcriptional regulator [Pseudomonadota bacterium]